MFYTEIVDYQKVWSLIASATGDSDEIANRIGSIIHNKIIFAILNPIPNPAKSEIAKKIGEGMSDPATIDFLVDRLGPGIKTVIRNAFNEAFYEIEGLL